MLAWRVEDQERHQEKGRSPLATRRTCSFPAQGRRHAAKWEVAARLPRSGACARVRAYLPQAARDRRGQVLVRVPLLVVRGSLGSASPSRRQAALHGFLIYATPTFNEDGTNG